MIYKHLEVTNHEDIMVVTLNRPEALNALNKEMLSELDNVITNVKYDSKTSIIIFTGSGNKAFCAGADLTEFVDVDYFQSQKVIEKGQTIFRKMELLGKPTIAAINGYALGGGLELSLACTIRLASTNAKFALPEVGLGMIPGYGGTQRLPRIIGKGKALELLITGRRIDAQQALSLGLVNHVYSQENLMEGAFQLGNEILENSQIAVSQLLQSVERGYDLPMDHALAFEQVFDSVASSSIEQKEGVKAFLEKRKPVFRKTIDTNK
ncbi:enoyl-CoA hydratase-related protein [Neobacillus sp. YX16]|uniref:enoyl-CoA hydratase/isomerase family protein n=1 Tax=Neobacillus sp. YX16 TaxID=3047874 RepID=UPI0024C21005|nr:enoyl-CoA hydratase-related protein [Neobacillus sp. YX16]WHZ00892.1 enoyl-CoA hydratase-related protein [Neobacillus sp. YX16]